MWLLFAGASAVLSAAAAIVQKNILFKLSPLEFSFDVSVMILVLSCALGVYAGMPMLPANVVLLIAGKSVLGAAAFLLVMTSLGRNQISTALPLLGLTPAAAALLSVPALGESLGVWEGAALVLMLAGTFLIEIRPSGFVSSRQNGFYTHAPIIGALLLFAISSVVDKKLVAGMKIDPSVVLVYQHVVYCAVFGLMIAVRTRTYHMVRMPSADAVATDRPGVFILLRRNLIGLALVAVLTLAYRFAQLEAAKDAPIALVLAVKRTSILFASLYGGRFFSDDRLGLKLAGAVLIVGAGFLILRFGV